MPQITEWNVHKVISHDTATLRKYCWERSPARGSFGGRALDASNNLFDFFQNPVPQGSRSFFLLKSDIRFRLFLHLSCVCVCAGGSRRQCLYLSFSDRLKFEVQFFSNTKDHNAAIEVTTVRYRSESILKAKRKTHKTKRGMQNDSGVLAETGGGIGGNWS